MTSASIARPTFLNPICPQRRRGARKWVLLVYIPLRPADDLARFGICHIEPMARRVGVMPCGKSRGTFVSGGSFEDIPEAVVRVAVAVV